MVSKTMRLTAARLKKLVRYSKRTGLFTCRVSGKTMGWSPSPYVSFSVDGQKHYAHRLAILYVTGRWPRAKVDHRNGVEHDNRWCNIRPATQSQNLMNKRMQRNNTSGHVGVYWFEPAQLWMAAIGVRGRQIHLGYFKRKADAIRARRDGARKHHGKFAR